MKEVAKTISKLCNGKWEKNYTYYKLISDPLYSGVLDELKESSLPLLDIGCGIGLLPLYLRENNWKPKITGVDYDLRKVKEGQKLISNSNQKGIQISQCDARFDLPAHEGNVTILDILQFFTEEEQNSLLSKVAKSIKAGGKLIIRTGIKDESLRFKITWLGDMLAKATFWMKAAPTSYPTTNQLNATLSKEGLEVEIRPFWGKTPFNNFIVVAKRSVTDT